MPDKSFKRSAFLVLLISVFCNAVGQLFFKYARIAHPDATLVNLFFYYEIWLAIFLYGLSSVGWLWTLSRVPLSYAYPVLALTFPVVVGLSAIIFAESVTLLHWIGVIVIVSGVALLSRT